jgi:hypothetical protein
MKIVAIRKIGRRPVYDLSVAEVQHYVLRNGVVTHNTGIYYSANTIFIVGRQQEKDGTEVIGYNFIINVEKSRFVREKSKIPVEVTYEDGVSKWGGLLELALECGFVIKPKNGWYQKIDPETGEFIEKNYRLNDTYNSDFWLPLLKSKKFNEFVENKYRLPETELLRQEDNVKDLMDELEED